MCRQRGPRAAEGQLHLGGRSPSCMPRQSQQLSEAPTHQSWTVTSEHNTQQPNRMTTDTSRTTKKHKKEKRQCKPRRLLLQEFCRRCKRASGISLCPFLSLSLSPVLSLSVSEFIDSTKATNLHLHAARLRVNAHLKLQVVYNWLHDVLPVIPQRSESVRRDRHSPQLIRNRGRARGTYRGERRLRMRRLLLRTRSVQQILRVNHF